MVGTSFDTVTKEVRLLEAVFENALDAKIIINSKQKIIKANKAAEKVFSLHNYENKPFFKFLASSTITHIRVLLNKLGSDPKVTQGLELKLNERVHHYDVAATQLDTNHILLIFRDITSTVNERESRNQFLSIAGHEIKTPLAVIQSYTNLLERKLADDGKNKQYLERITQKVEVLSNYVTSMVDEIKIGTGKFEYNDKEEDFYTIIHEIIVELRRMIPERTLSLRGKTTKKVFIDKHRIQQVVSNLIYNANKYSKKDKQIVIKISEDDTHVILKVIDYGIGISTNDQRRIFKAFYRSSNNNNSQAGLGLGLYISSKIIDRYGGKMSVTSKYRKGSTFAFTIPVHFS